METIITPTTELTVRSIREADYVEAVELINAADRAVVGHNILTVEELATDLQPPEMNVETDTRVALSREGKMIGYADYWHGPQPHVRVHGFVRIHPEHKCEGVGTALTNWLEQRAADDLMNAPEDLKVSLGQRVYSTQLNARNFLENRGYCHLRSSYRMTIDLDEAIPQPVWPDEYVVRTIQRTEEDLRRAIRAEQEAFLDHYGVTPEPFDTYYERRVHLLLNESSIDFSACYMVLDGDEVAAVDINAVAVADDQTTGWIGTLSVRRPWRKHGLGLALLLTSFHEMRRRGKQHVGLYVDAENLTGALRLYQKAGMHVDYENCYYEKELRSGKDLANKG